MTDDKHEEARKRYEDARQLRMLFDKIAACPERRAAWNDFEHVYTLALEDEQRWLGRYIDPVENGSIEERERRERH